MSESAAVLQRDAVTMRRKRIVYYAIIAVVVIGFAIFAGVTYSRGEVAHARLHTVSRAPAPLAIDTPSATQRPLWRTNDHLANGTSPDAGTVITYSTHTVRGRDARTGKPTWSYTRTDRTVCNAVLLANTAVAVYAVHGNCDELGAFDSGTGARRWTRTLDKDGVPLNGRPTYQANSSTLLITSHSAIYAIDPSSGLDRWTYTRFGCHIERAVLGTAGVLISQACTAAVRCTSVSFCGRGPQLLLRHPSAGTNDGKPNADRLKWNDIGNTDIPVSADQVIAAVNRTSRGLDTFIAGSGKHSTRVRLTPAPSSLSDIALAPETTDAEVLWIDGTTYAISGERSTPLWTAPTIAAPTVVSIRNDGTPTLATARLTVATSSGVAALDGTDGAVRQRFTLPARAGAVVYPQSTGFLVADPAGLVAYR